MKGADGGSRPEEYHCTQSAQVVDVEEWRSSYIFISRHMISSVQPRLLQVESSNGVASSARRPDVAEGIESGRAKSSQCYRSIPLRCASAICAVATTVVQLEARRS